MCHSGDNFNAPEMAVWYNKFMGGTDVFDRIRLTVLYSMERHVICQKWWQKYFWGIFDMAVTNAYICWKSVDVKRRSHEQFIEELHKGLVNNCFDVSNSWGITDVPPPLTRTPKKVKNTIQLTPQLELSPQIVREHKLVAYKSTLEYAYAIKSKSTKPRKRFTKRCQQCLSEKIPDNFTSFVCTGCNHTWLCNVNSRNCFVKWHVQMAEKVKMERLRIQV